MSPFCNIGNPSDPLYEVKEGTNQTTLRIGADVEYAKSLEKRYAIFARAIDVSESKMLRVAETQVKNALGL